MMINSWAVRSTTISRACAGTNRFTILRYQQTITATVRAVRPQTNPSALPSSLHSCSKTTFNNGSSSRGGTAASAVAMRRLHCTSRSASTTSAAGASGGGSQAFGVKGAAGKKGGVTVSSSKPVAAWLFGTAGAVAVMVTVGGITRMTKSGLSMTDWKVQGSLPPTTEDEWHAEFKRYKTYPEWQQRRSMTLEEFKHIFFWEYAHRMLGRALGLIYGLPLLYFSGRGRIPHHIRGRVAALLALGGGQGLVGWWMVKSGLENRHEDLASGKEIRVSPYRLAAHLATAFATFSLLVHTGLEALHGPRSSSLPASAQALLEAGLLKHASRLRLGAGGVCFIAFVTAVSGAFVAGNDAGRCYNTFPKMTDDHWLPEEILSLQPLWRNFFENSATVQADHRVLALTTTASALGLLWYARRGAAGGALWAALPKSPRMATGATAALVTGQASLGITTLLNCAPMPLAASHQVGALTVLASSMWASHTLRFADTSLVVSPSSTVTKTPPSKASSTVTAIPTPAAATAEKFSW